MSNALLLAPHPTDPSRLYFALEGTTLTLIDDRGTILQRAVLPIRNADAIVFSPATPTIIYFALKISTMS
jgi:hypothetical protein